MAAARWNGDIDEVAVYDRGLSAAEVASLYQIAVNGAAAPQIVTQPVSQTVFLGQPVVFSVAVDGRRALHLPMDTCGHEPARRHQENPEHSERLRYTTPALTP